VEGLAPIVAHALENTLVNLKKEERLTILLSEQNLRFATGISDRAYVIEKGVIRYQGAMGELAADEEVKQRYLAV